LKRCGEVLSFPSRAHAGEISYMPLSAVVI
jgi:hypothetical protein